MTHDPKYRHCRTEAERMRSDIERLERNRDWNAEKLRATDREMAELERAWTRRPGEFAPEGEPRLRWAELDARYKELLRERDELNAQIANARSDLQAKERECWAIDHARRDDAPTHDDLRRAIDRTEYWRDGDPALARFVSDGFKRLYPDDSPE